MKRDGGWSQEDSLGDSHITCGDVKQMNGVVDTVGINMDYKTYTMQ